MLRKKMMVVMAMATVMSAVVIGCGSSNSVETSTTVATPVAAVSEVNACTADVISHGAEVVAEIAKILISTEANEALAATETEETTEETTEATSPTEAAATTAPAKTETTPQATANTNTTAPAATNNATAEKAHTHNFQPIYRTVHHDAVTEDQGHYENVMVQDAKYETQTIRHSGIQCSCGAAFYGDNANAEYDAHSTANIENPACARSKTVGYDETVSVKVSDPVYQNQWVSNVVTIQAAYDEQVLDHNECSCGARQ